MTDHLQVLVVVAHPDEAEEYVAGTMALLADRGHHVKVLSTTNGDAGHHALPPKKLARLRAQEAYAAAGILGLADYEIWDEHDGELMDSKANRRRMIRAIRRWRTDLILTFTDEGPGHTDNRMAAQLVRQVLPFAALPNPCRDTPALAEQPVVLRMIDYGSVDRHRVDVAVDTSAVMARKLRACAAHASQFLEFAPHGNGWAAEVPPVEDTAAVDDFILRRWQEYMVASADARPALERAYGPAGSTIEFAETFELAPYGRAVSAEQVDKLLSL
jgi:LmbE family N-acetylglucosaminyl deacetylase